MSVLRSPGLTSGARAAWVVGVLIFPLLGPAAWFLVGRSGAPAGQVARQPPAGVR